MFEVNPGLSVWTIIVFLMFVFVLGKFAWKPMLQMLEEREKGIRDSLNEAEQARHEAEELLARNEANRARAEEEYKRVVTEARQEAERKSEEILQKARQQAQRDLELAREEIQRTTEQARLQLRKEIANLAIGAAEKILEESLDAKKHRQLVEQFLRKPQKN